MILLVLALLFSPQEKAPERCTLSGTVVNAATGEPLAKVRILAEGGDAESNSVPAAASDAKGKFTLVNLSPGRYRLRGQRNGFLDTFYGARRAEGNGTPIVLEPGQQMGDLVLKLIPSGVIAGTVRDADGEPLSRIPVTVHRVKYDYGRRRIERAGGAYTDDLGQYRIPDLAPGKYYVHAEAVKAREFGSSALEDVQTEDHSAKDSAPLMALLPATFPSVQDVGPGARVTGVDITLPRSLTVSVKGNITPPAGMTINSLYLQYASAESDDLGLHLVTRAGEKGEFVFPAVPAGNYVLTGLAQAGPKPQMMVFDMFPQQVKMRIPLQVGTSDVSGVRMVMDAAAQVTGKVTVEGGRDSKFAGNFIQFDDGESDRVTAMVSEENTFEWALAPGRYRVLINDLDGDLVVRSIRAGGRDILDEGLTVSEPGKIAVEVVLGHDGGQLDGVVLDGDDKAVAGATVVLVPESRPRTRVDLYRQAETDQYGRFHFEGIAPGDYQVFAWDDVEPGIWWDAEFLKKYESQAERVKVDAKGKASAKVHVAKE